MSSITILTVEGNKLNLAPVDMPSNPTKHGAMRYLAFLKKYSEGHTLSQSSARLLKAFLKRHFTEAVTDRHEYFALVDDQLVICDPDMLSKTQDHQGTVVKNGRYLNPNQIAIDGNVITIMSLSEDNAIVNVEIDDEQWIGKLKFDLRKMDYTGQRTKKDVRQFIGANLFQIHMFCHWLKQTSTPLEYDQ